MRLTATILVFVLVFGTLTTLLLSKNKPSPYTVVSEVAKPGDTAWDLVTKVNSHMDPRKAIWAFKKLNGTAQIRAGAVVKIPVYHN